MSTKREAGRWMLTLADLLALILVFFILNYVIELNKKLASDSIKQGTKSEEQSGYATIVKHNVPPVPVKYVKASETVTYWYYYIKLLFSKNISDIIPTISNKNSHITVTWEYDTLFDKDGNFTVLGRKILEITYIALNNIDAVFYTESYYNPQANLKNNMTKATSQARKITEYFEEMGINATRLNNSVTANDQVNIIKFKFYEKSKVS